MYLLELGARYLVLFGLEKYEVINKIIRYLICQKIGVAYVFCHDYARIEVDRIDISDGIDVNKKSELKECNFCHYWYFLDKGS